MSRRTVKLPRKSQGCSFVTVETVAAISYFLVPTTIHKRKIVNVMNQQLTQRINAITQQYNIKISLKE